MDRATRPDLPRARVWRRNRSDAVHVGDPLSAGRGATLTSTSAAPSSQLCARIDIAGKKKTREMKTHGGIVADATTQRPRLHYTECRVAIMTSGKLFLLTKSFPFFLFGQMNFPLVAAEVRDWATRIRQCVLSPGRCATRAAAASWHRSIRSERRPQPIE